MPLLIAMLTALTPEPLEGPFESLAAYCAQQPQPEECEPDADGQAQGEWDPRRVGQSDLRGDGAIARVRVFVHDDACLLGIEVDSGWWIRPEPLTLCRNSGSASPRFRVTGLALRDAVGSGEADLVLRVRADFIHGIDGWHRTDSLFVCGVGDGGEPSCLPEIIEESRWRCIADRETCDYFHQSAPPRRRALAVTFRRHRLVIKRRVGKLHDSQRAMVGRHRIAWLSDDEIAAAPRDDR